MTTRHNSKAPGDLDPDFGSGGIAYLPETLPNAWSVLLSDGKILTSSRIGPDIVLLRHLSDGSPDTAFGENGVKRLHALAPTDAVRMDVFADDSALIYTKTLTGEGEVMVLLRTLPDGNLDTRFGDNGTFRFSIGLGINNPRGAVLQDDGKIVLSVMVGYPPYYDDAFIARLDNGKLDPQFGQFGSGIVYVARNQTIRDMVALPKQRLLLAGHVGNALFFSRRMPNGRPDPEFGVDGTVLIPIQGTASAVLERILRYSDGKILAVGTAGDNWTGNSTLTLRIDENGQLDPAFNNGEPLIIGFQNFNSSQYGVALQSDNKIVTVGQLFGEPEASDLLLMRLLADGTLDPQFGTDGKVLSSWNGLEISDTLALQSDGKILVCGDAIDLEAGQRRKLMARYLG